MQSPLQRHHATGRRERWGVCVLWQPQVQTGDNNFGVQSNELGFTIRWARDRVIVVEAATDLANPTWSAIGTNTLTGGASYFSDPEWANRPARFYRLRSP